MIVANSGLTYFSAGPTFAQLKICESRALVFVSLQYVNLIRLFLYDDYVLQKVKLGRLYAS